MVVEAWPTGRSADGGARAARLSECPRGAMSGWQSAAGKEHGGGQSPCCSVSAWWNLAGQNVSEVDSRQIRMTGRQHARVSAGRLAEELCAGVSAGDRGFDGLSEDGMSARPDL